MTSGSKSKQEEALQFLNDLDSLSPDANVAQPQPGNEREAAEVLAFLDEITQKSAEPTRTTTSHLDRPLSRAGTPTLRKSVERVKVGAQGALLPSSSSSPKSENTGDHLQRSKPDQPTQTSAGGGWGWGSVWSSASAAIQQAKTAVDEQVKHLPKNEQARKWGEGVLEYAKTAQLEKLGQDFKRVGLSTLTDILNVVAPPISEHEVIQVWLSHDMKGYDGIETLVYRALTRIMEQVEGGDLVVNKGKESRPKESSDDSRELNAVETYDAAYKLAQANLQELIKQNQKPPKEKEDTNPAPITYSDIYLRVQPFATSYVIPGQPAVSEDTIGTQESTETSLQFILLLMDPGHQLVHTTITQSVPRKWLDLWERYDWVEDLVAEALRLGVEVVGQQYIVARMGWGKPTTATKEADGEGEYNMVDEKAAPTLPNA